MQEFSSRLKDEHGSALIAAVLISLVMTLTGLYSAYQATTEMRIASNNKSSIQAFYVAEAGIEQARMQLPSICDGSNCDDTGNANWRTFIGTPQKVATLFPNETVSDSDCYDGHQSDLNLDFTVRLKHKLDSNGKIVCWGDANGDGTPEQNTSNVGWPVEIATSIGLAPGGSSKAQTKILVEFIRKSGSPFKYGLFGDIGVTLSGNGLIDSYVPTDGPYSTASRRQNGHVATNNTATASISLTGNADIYGDVAVGYGGNPETGIHTSGHGTIYGDETSLAEVQDMAPLDDPGGGATDSLSLSGNSSKTFSSGEYRLPSISISGNGDAYINGNVTFYVSGNTSISGNGCIHVQPGCSLTIYASGAISIAGNGIINGSNLPDHLLIYGTQSCTSVSISGNGDLYAGLYIPNANFSVSGNGDLFGSVIADRVSISGNGDIHYDEDLTNVPVFPGDYKILSWKDEY